MRITTCDGCKKTLTEGIGVKWERTAAKTRFYHFCGPDCYAGHKHTILGEQVHVGVPTPGDKVTVTWTGFTDEQPSPGLQQVIGEGPQAVFTPEQLANLKAGTEYAQNRYGSLNEVLNISSDRLAKTIRRVRGEE